MEAGFRVCRERPEATCTRPPCTPTQGRAGHQGSRAMAPLQGLLVFLPCQPPCPTAGQGHSPFPREPQHHPPPTLGCRGSLGLGPAGGWRPDGSNQREGLAVSCSVGSRTSVPQESWHSARAGVGLPSYWGRQRSPSTYPPWGTLSGTSKEREGVDVAGAVPATGQRTGTEAGMGQRAGPGRTHFPRSRKVLQ